MIGACKKILRPIKYFIIYFKENYTVIIEQITGDKSRLLHGALIYGLLTPVSRIVFENTSRGPFEQMNLAHKKRAESC